MSTHTDIQREFIEKIADAGTDAAIEWLLSVKNGKEHSYPLGVTLRWIGDGSQSYDVVLSERSDVADGFVYTTAEDSDNLA